MMFDLPKMGLCCYSRFSSAGLFAAYRDHVHRVAAFEQMKRKWFMTTRRNQMPARPAKRQTYLFPQPQPISRSFISPSPPPAAFRANSCKYEVVSDLKLTLPQWWINVSLHSSSLYPISRRRSERSSSS
ncbi:hypothetical protein [Paenibacillus sp. YAF4_2]|uniref:hypothetical protein n=1 Tax=Paenibacillus sp. YAF4_2 TaxID=3233085 RepID=UPI003F986587